MRLKLTLQWTIKESTAEQFAAENPEQFDVVTCMEMLEHVPDPESIIQSLVKMVKLNGHVFVSTLICKRLPLWDCCG